MSDDTDTKTESTTDTTTDPTNTSTNDTSNNDVTDDDTDDDIDDDDNDYDADADDEPATQLLFSSFGSVTINDASQVTVPADRARDFANAATYFSKHTNRHTMTVDLGSTDAAKLFAKQVNSYGRSHKLSTSPKRDETKVTFRFAAKREASNGGQSSEVTTTKQEPTVKPASELKIPTPASVPSQRKSSK